MAMKKDNEGALATAEKIGSAFSLELTPTTLKRLAGLVAQTATPKKRKGGTQAKTKARGGKMKMAKMRGGGRGMGTQTKTKARGGKMKMASRKMRGGMNKKK